MGKRIFLFGILTFLIVSCTNNNDETVLPKRVTSVKYIALIYDDITLSNYYNPSSGKISFEYDNLNRINKTLNPLAVNFKGKPLLEKLRGENFLIRLINDNESRYNILLKNIITTETNYE